MNTKLIAIKQDITTLKVDAIVNAANRRLLGGGGVDGAIHRVAGEELYQECLTLNGCMEGEAKITKGYNLPAKWVIHTVGPIYNNENGREADMLREAAPIAIASVKEFLVEEDHRIEVVYFVCFSDEDLEVYERLLA
jgi:O-acetyl-ADP-ribose deacetylase (regulator of RNase III)